MNVNSKFVMPYIAWLISSDFWLLCRRHFHEAKRVLTGQPHKLDIFICASDPYSYLLLQVLPEITARFDVEISLHTIQDLPSEMFPEVSLWQSNSINDADRLATLYELKSPKTGFEYVMSEASIRQVTQMMLSVEKQDDAVSLITSYLYNLWHGIETPLPSVPQMDDQLQANQGLFRRLGHYLPATIHYAGEWYWGLDRLEHLEQRLNKLIVNRGVNEVRYDKQRLQLEISPRIRRDRQLKPIEMFYSARSPYSYVGLEIATKLARHYGCELHIFPVMPMAMRGMTVPNKKKMYIFHDAKREAKKHGIPFGFVADPLGQAVEYCYGIFNYARTIGRGQEFLLAFSRAVFCKGKRLDSIKGIMQIAKQVGLKDDEAFTSIHEASWIMYTELNKRTLLSHGMWGVPCFKYGDTVTWGQDRLWLIEQRILEQLQQQISVRQDDHIF